MIDGPLHEPLIPRGSNRPYQINSIRVSFVVLNRAQLTVTGPSGANRDAHVMGMPSSDLGMTVKYGMPPPTPLLAQTIPLRRAAKTTPPSSSMPTIRGMSNARRFERWHESDQAPKAAQPRPGSWAAETACEIGRAGGKRWHAMQLGLPKETNIDLLRTLSRQGRHEREAGEEGPLFDPKVLRVVESDDSQTYARRYARGGRIPMAREGIGNPNPIAVHCQPNPIAVHCQPQPQPHCSTLLTPTPLHCRHGGRGG